MSTQSKREELAQDLEEFGCGPHHYLIKRDAASSDVQHCLDQVWHASPAQIDEYHATMVAAFAE